jgi:hypothetical protein
MSLEHRAAYFEFLDKNTIQVTTVFRQKTFQFTEKDDGFFIDLHKLQKYESVPDSINFYACVSHDGDETILEIWARKHDTGYRDDDFHVVDTMTNDDNKRKVSVRYVVKD